MDISLNLYEIKTIALILRLSGENASRVFKSSRSRHLKGPFIIGLVLIEIRSLMLLFNFSTCLQKFEVFY